MIRRYLFSGVGSSGATSRCLHRTWPLKIHRHSCSDAIHRRCVGSSGAENPATKSSLLSSTRPSDRPTLPLVQGVRSSGAEGFILARLCLDSNWASDRPTVSSLRSRITRRYCLHCSSSATRPMLLKSGPSVHPMVPRVSPFELTCPTIAPTLAIKWPSVHPTVSFLFLFLLGFDPWFSHFGMWYSCILGT
jgi:hypothetical protein